MVNNLFIILFYYIWYSLFHYIMNIFQDIQIITNQIFNDVASDVQQIWILIAYEVIQVQRPQFV